MVNLESRKLSGYLTAGVGLLLIININLIFSRLNLSIDLTGDGRHTLSTPVKQLLRNLDDVVYIDVYLKGDFPPGFERLENSTLDILKQFRSVSGSNIQYEFIDPQEARGPAGRRDMVKYLGGLGIQPTNLYANENGKRTEKLIFPGAVISFAGRETGVMLLKGNKSAPPQERLNQSIEGLEFEFASAINNLVNIEKKKIGIIRGHGELDSVYIESALKALKESFDVIYVNLPLKSSLAGYDAVIIAKPTLPVPEFDIYKLDQFIMNGGKAIFMLDVLHVDEDSIGEGGTIAYPIVTNLDNLLFKYGIRINKDYVLDLNSGAFPVVTGNMGNAPNFQLIPWPYYPMLNHFGLHPVVRNMDAVYSKYVSSLDTVFSEGVKKTPLVYTSPYTRLASAPVRISLNDLREEMNAQSFTHGPVMVACLLEGTFTSLYKNRFLPEGADQNSFMNTSLPAKIIVFSDGDIIRNDIDIKNKSPYELGFDPWLQTSFANRDFLLNAVSYLADDQGIILSRSRQVKLRPLDKVKISNETTKWQLINLLVPVLLVAIAGYSRQIFRKNRYRKQ